MLACGKSGAHMAEACERFYLDGGRIAPDRLTGVAGTRHVSITMALQASVAVLLHRHGAGTDIPLGGLVSGRVDETLDDLVGGARVNLETDILARYVARLREMAGA